MWMFIFNDDAIAFGAVHLVFDKFFSSQKLLPSVWLILGNIKSSFQPIQFYWMIDSVYDNS